MTKKSKKEKGARLDLLMNEDKTRMGNLIENIMKNRVDEKKLMKSGTLNGT